MAFFLTVILLCGAGIAPSRAADKLVLVAAAGTIDTVVSEVILREAYGRIGIDVTIRKVKPERALRLANAGQVDGDVQRIAGLEAHYTNLVAVRPRVNFIDFAAFVVDQPFTVEGWRSLEGRSVGYVRGIKIAEQHVGGMDAAAAGSYESMFRMLAGGRFAVAIAPQANGAYHASRLGLTDVVGLSPALERIDLFHYLHRSHDSLIPRIGHELEIMRESGELALIREQVIRVIMAGAVRGESPCDSDYSCFPVSEWLAQPGTAKNAEGDQ
jgi:ABC-type amino acid transport substrate-binding protein